MNVRTLLFVALIISVTTMIACAQQRSDSEIRAELQRRIRMDTRPITVQVQNGVVTLTGTVRTLPQKQSIINIARRTPGVRDVIDRITASPAERRPDGDIERSIRDSLEKNLSREELQAIIVRAQNGMVTLTGTLPSSYPKQVAEALASLAVGVTDVRNEITVSPPQRRTDSDIFADVTRRFTQNPVIPANLITVTVVSGVITLAGTVDSFIQADQAESAARFVPGVVDVRNQLFVRATGG